VKRLVLALVASAALMAPGPVAAAPHPGDDAAPFSLPGVKGGTVSLAAYKNKPVYLNFFASWCGPCNEEAAAVAGFDKKYRRRGLAIVGIDEQEDNAKAVSFARKYRWQFPVALDDGEMGKRYGVYGLPVHIFIDKHGKLSTYRLGEMQTSEIEEAIRKIL